MLRRGGRQYGKNQSQAKLSSRRPAVTGFGSLQAGGTQQSHLAGFAPRLPVRHRAVHRLVLLGAPVSLQSHRGGSQAYEAADAGLLSPELAAGIARVKGVKQLGHRSGNWVSLDQSSEVLKHASGDSLRARRDYAMLSMLLGCGLRRSELVGLEMDEVQRRQGHWAIVDLIGKGKHIRTVPIPEWAKAALDVWTAAAGIKQGRIFRAVARTGKMWGDNISQNIVWYVVKTCCERTGLEHIAPHDLRRTCAKLCYTNGGEIEQIQFLLGHASVQTTERYLGCKQNLGHPVNHLLRLGNTDVAA